MSLTLWNKLPGQTEKSRSKIPPEGFRAALSLVLNKPGQGTTMSVLFCWTVADVPPISLKATGIKPAPPLSQECAVCLPLCSSLQPLAVQPIQTHGRAHWDACHSDFLLPVIGSYTG